MVNYWGSESSNISLVVFRRVAIGTLEIYLNTQIFPAEHLIFEYKYRAFISRIYSSTRKNLTNIFEYLELNFTFVTLDKCPKSFKFFCEMGPFFVKLCGRYRILNSFCDHNRYFPFL